LERHPAEEERKLTIEDGWINDFEWHGRLDSVEDLTLVPLEPGSLEARLLDGGLDSLEDLTPFFELYNALINLHCYEDALGEH